MLPDPTQPEPISLKTDDEVAAEILLSKEPPALARPRVLRPVAPVVEPPTVRPADRPVAMPKRSSRPVPKPRSRRGLFVILSMAAVILIFAIGLGVYIFQKIDDFNEKHSGVAVVRIPPGDYPLDDSTKTETWGDHPLGSTFVPGYTIRGTAPDNDLFYVLPSVSRGATVTREKTGEPTQTRELADVLGDWVELSIGADNLVWVKGKERSSESIVVKYTLHVTNPRFLASSDSYALINAESKLADQPAMANASKSMDTYQSKLRSFFGGDSGVVREFRTEQAKIEAAGLKSKSSEADAAKAIEAHRASLDWGHPSETLYWITVLHGRLLTPEQIAAVQKEFTFPMASSYDEARRQAAPRAALAQPGFGLVMPTLVFEKKPDDFEGIVAMLMWATEDVRGPTITLISERTWTVGLTTHWERIFEYKYHLARKQLLQDFVLNAYRGLRTSEKDLPAAVRLSKAIEQASSTPGLLGKPSEPQFNLRYSVDMRDCDRPSGHTAFGYARDNVWFWRETLDRYPNLFSDDNKHAIRNGRAPVIDAQWIKLNPRHEEYEGQRLDPYHLGQGPYATPVPRPEKEPPTGTTALFGGVPQGLTQEQFDDAGRTIRSRVGNVSSDIVVQGSRATGTAKPDSDIDFAIRVPAAKFDQLIQEKFGTPNPGSAKERTMKHAMETGKIQTGEAGLRPLRKELEDKLKMEVDISIIRKGGPFDSTAVVAVP